MSDVKDKLLKNIRTDEDLRDLSYVVDGEEIKVNRTLMAASCDYFKTMLYGKTNEAKQSRIVLTCTPLEAFKKVVEFIYTDYCNIDEIEEVNLIELIGLAHLYQFEELLNFLFPKINVDKRSVDFNIALFDLTSGKIMEKWREEILEYFDILFVDKV
ncbi:BTB/POZ domain-containing protein 9-like protein, partial [Leptotrombidium deliense]